jgi:RTA1 like protein
MSAAVYQFYRYDPLLAPAIVSLSVFVITTAIHIYQLTRTRAWYMIPMIVGGISSLLRKSYANFTVSIVGYVGRIISINNITSETPFILQSVLIVLAPAFFAATVYMTLGRVITFLNNPHLSILPHRRLTTIFVLGDVLSFFVQGSGAGFMAKSSDNAHNTGSLIIVGGLVVQLLFFGMFFVALIFFDIRCRHQSLSNPPVSYNGNTGIHWYKVVIALYVASTLISIRCVFRTTEFASGFDGYLQSHEAFFYVFDALPMVVTMAVFNIVVPGWALKGDRKEFDNLQMTVGMKLGDGIFEGSRNVTP